MLDRSSLQSTLQTLIQLRSHEINTLAQAWLANGATHFGIMVEGEFVYAVPDSPFSLDGNIEASFRFVSGTLGYVYVEIEDTQSNRLRLNADSVLVGQLLLLEQELETMTEELIAHQDQILALYDLNRSLRNYLDLSGSLSVLARDSRRLTNSETAFVLLQIDGEVKIERNGAYLFPTPFLESLLEDVRSTKRHYLTNSQRLNKAPINLLCLPIQVGGQIAGMLVFIRSSQYASPDIKLAESLAEQAGAHIENVLLHQESVEQAKLQTEVELAQHVQSRLLPPTPPPIKGIDLFGSSVAASEVGGDFYDFILSKDYPLMFAIGDVAGKGLSAAMVMTMTRTAIRSVANITGIHTPKEVIHRVNEDLYEDFTEIGVFTTVFIGQYVRESDEIVFANSGHSPVIYLLPGKSAQILMADGTAVGVLPTSFCENQTLPMPIGAVLVALTDGFPEAEDHAGEMFGYDRLLRIVEESAHHTAEEIAYILYDSVKMFQSGKSQSDDQTVIVLKRVPR